MLGLGAEVVLGLPHAFLGHMANVSSDHQWDILVPGHTIGGIFKGLAKMPQDSLQLQKWLPSQFPTLTRPKPHLLSFLPHPREIQTASLCLEGPTAQLLFILTSNSPLSAQGAFGIKLQEGIQHKLLFPF